MVLWPKNDLSIMHFIDVASKESWMWHQKWEKLVLASLVLNAIRYKRQKTILWIYTNVLWTDSELFFLR